MRSDRAAVSAWSVAVLLGVRLATPAASCAQVVYDVESRPVTIWSEGTRMAGTLWWPEDAAPEAKLPAIRETRHREVARRHLHHRPGDGHRSTRGSAPRGAPPRPC